MKKTLLFIIIFCNYSYLIAQNDNATLKETTDWMTSKVKGDYSSLDHIYYNVSLVWDEEKKIMKYISYQSKTLLGQPISGYFVLEFDPKNIDPKSLNISEMGSYIKIDFSCNVGTGCIKSYSLNYNEKGDLVKKELVDWSGNQISLFQNVLKENEDLPNRFIKAFKHLIKLRGGKGETF